MDGYNVFFLTQVQQFQMMVGKAMPATTGREIAVSGFSINTRLQAEQLHAYEA